MKSIISLLFTLTISIQALAVDDSTVLTCEGRNGSFAYVNIQKYSDSRPSTIVYNYSNASVICPFDVEYRVKDRAQIKCVGLWSFDFDRNSQTTRHLDTIATVTITPNIDDQDFTAEFHTNLAYGNRKITAICKVP